MEADNAYQCGLKGFKGMVSDISVLYEVLNRSR